MINPIFEIIGLSAAFLTTSAFIPQVYKIYKDKNADGISLTMYIILFIGVLLWLIVWSFDWKSFNNYCKWNYCTFTVEYNYF